MNLKTSLILRIVSVGILCFGLVMGGVLLQTQRSMQKFAGKTADLVARQLELQRLRIDANYDSSIRFPEWDAIASHTAMSGQCTSFTGPAGEMLRNSCVGAPASDAITPRWFSWLHRLLFSAAHSAEREVSYKNRNYGMVRVTVDPAAVIGQSWREFAQMLTLTIATILSLCLLVYFAIERALKPAKDVVSGLNQLADGAFDHRLPKFQLAEFQRIGEVTNQLAEKIETSLSESSDLLKRLMSAQEKERSYLARELHDEFAQNLTAINAFARSIGKTAEEHYPELCVEAENLSQISANMMEGLRKTLLHLKPADLDKFGLIESLAQLITLWNATSGGQTHFQLEAPEEIGPLPEEAALHIFRIAQEALTNAAKHANAKNVKLSIDQMGDDTRLLIEDDGKNGHAWCIDSVMNGMGILNMRERVAALGGSISFDQKPDAGLAVRVTIPVMSEQGAHG